MSFSIQTPYLLFLGDAPDMLAAKVADGIAHWRPDNVVGQFKLKNCQAGLGIDDLTLEQGLEKGAKTLVIGVANRGGVIPDNWLASLVKAMELGYDIASGLHSKLNDYDILRKAAEKCNRRLLDVRIPYETYPIGHGKKRKGRRILAVGTDCSVGKMFTALALEKALHERKLPATFRATGQTGILITGQGVPLDAVISDFLSGAIEHLSPDNDDENHWDVIEGQGSLFHPSFAGVSMGLLHGAAADALVLCHEPTRAHMRGLPHVSLPTIDETIYLNEYIGKRTNENCKVIGFSINTSHMDEGTAKEYLQDLENRFNLPATDPVRFGVDKLINQII